MNVEKKWNQKEKRKILPAIAAIQEVVDGGKGIRKW